MMNLINFDTVIAEDKRFLGTIQVVLKDLEGFIKNDDLYFEPEPVKINRYLEWERLQHTHVVLTEEIERRYVEASVATMIAGRFTKDTKGFIFGSSNWEFHFPTIAEVLANLDAARKGLEEGSIEIGITQVTYDDINDKGFVIADYTKTIKLEQYLFELEDVLRFQTELRKKMAI